jgi:hypothetical protein
MALTQHLFANRSLLTPVVLYRRGGGVEPLALIVIFDGSIGGVHRRRSSSTEVALGGADGANPCHWRRRWWSLSTTVIFNGGGGGIEPTALIVVVDAGVGGLCQQ